MNRIGFGVSSENIISMKAMASVGCTQEGVLRSFLPSENGTTRVDIILFSILKEEWDLRIKKKLKEKLKLYT